MSDIPNRTGRTSFAFEKRAELPSYGSTFDHDAGKARDDFAAARSWVDAQPGIILAGPEDGQPEPRWRTPRFVLPDPHPSFAPPNRRRRELGPPARAIMDDDTPLLTREAFDQARRQPGTHARTRPKHHDR